MKPNYESGRMLTTDLSDLMERTQELIDGGAQFVAVTEWAEAVLPLLLPAFRQAVADGQSEAINTWRNWLQTDGGHLLHKAFSDDQVVAWRHSYLKAVAKTASFLVGFRQLDDEDLEEAVAQLLREEVPPSVPASAQKPFWRDLVGYLAGAWVESEPTVRTTTVAFPAVLFLDLPRKDVNPEVAVVDFHLEMVPGKESAVFLHAEDAFTQCVGTDFMRVFHHAVSAAVSVLGAEAVPSARVRIQARNTEFEAALSNSVLGGLSGAGALALGLMLLGTDRGDLEPGSAVSFALTATSAAEPDGWCHPVTGTDDKVRGCAHHDVRRLLVSEAQRETLARSARVHGVELIGITTFQEAVDRVFAWADAAKRPVSPDEVPPVRNEGVTPSQRAPRHVASRLPTYLTSFVGREEELLRLMDQALPAKEGSAPRRCLITLLGAGGTGKTRLAVEFARRSAQRLEQQLWFVALADLDEPGHILDAVCLSLRLELEAGDDPLQKIADYFASLDFERPSVLILDNFEHLVDAGAPVVRQLLAAVPSLVVIVTSRRRLNLEGEHEFPVWPLPVPGGDLSPQSLDRCASVQLFLDRARENEPGLELSLRNARSVAALCERLEGIPLAVELAARWVGTLSLEEILEQLQNRFALMTSQRSTGFTRHLSLWAAIEWSYLLLSPDLQELLLQLATFRGGWTLQTGSSFCGAVCTPHQLRNLRERSLIVAESSDGRTRYRFLETIREFGLAKQPDDQREELMRRHAELFAAFVKREKGADQFEDATWFDQVHADQDNFRQALGWLIDHDPHNALSMAAALVDYWFTRGVYREGLTWIRRCLAAAPQPSTLGVSLRLGGAKIATSAGDHAQARLLLQPALEHSQLLNHPEGIAGALQALATLDFREGANERARRGYEEALVIQKRRGDCAAIAVCLHALGVLAYYEGNSQEARSLLEQSLAQRREIGRLSDVARVLNLLGFARMGEDGAAARDCFQEALTLARRMGDVWFTASTIYGLTLLTLLAGDLRAARTLFEESLEGMRTSGAREGAAGVGVFLALTLFLLGDCSSGRERLREALAEQVTVRIHRDLPASFEIAAHMAAVEGGASRASMLLGYAAALRERYQVAILPVYRDFHERTVFLARQALGGECFTAKWIEGRLLLDTDAVTLVNLDSSGPD
jgi:predicted ATPase